MNYYQHSTRRIELGGESLILYSKPGMVAWDDVAAAHSVLADDVDIQPTMCVLVLESPMMAIYAARLGADVHLLADNLIALRMAKLMMDANHVDINIHPSAYSTDENAYDVALMVNPKGRAYARLLLNAAFRALKVGGRLLMCGAKDAGAQAIATDAGEIFGVQAVTLRTKAHQRLSAVRKENAVEPQSHREHRESTEESLVYEGLRLYTLPGVFSREGVDAGTAMLLSTLDEATCAEKSVLDVGCGSGVIGMSAAKLGVTQVDMLDVSLLALECARRGVEANDLGDKCRVFGSDLYSDIADGEQYDLILSNPPFHAGHSVDTAASEALISGAREHLAKGGALRLVANRFLAYDKLMRKVFAKVEIVKEDGKFWVLEGRG